MIILLPERGKGEPVKGIYLGAWDFPSGNRMEVWLRPDDGDDIRHAPCRWDRWPPSREDKVYSLEVVAPQIMARLCEYLEIPASDARLQLPEERRGLREV